MGDLSEHFSRSEFRCRCGCGLDTVDFATLAVLEAVSLQFGNPVKVTSGYRCAKHNKNVGGAPNSQHLYGRACDIQVRGIKPKMVYAFLDDLLEGVGGVGLYPTFTHVDTRSNGPARW